MGPDMGFGDSMGKGIGFEFDTYYSMDVGIGKIFFFKSKDGDYSTPSSSIHDHP